MNELQKNAGKSAWVVAIGDELISGQRLDTNSQWISQRLEQLGVEVKRHCCVGDSHDDGVGVFSSAIDCTDIVVCTGGIGPTQDDLTRQVLADVAGVQLIFDPKTEEHIRGIFESYGRQMPENNRVQAYFPAGSTVIPNREGTAPGIDLLAGDCRIFSLPGVPYEMKQMWDDHVEKEILDVQGQQKVIHHHAIHCFGAGESQIELMLEGMTDRGREPRVGITASQATISLRITATGNSAEQCQSNIQATAKSIESKLGDLIFGSNGVQLEDVVISELVRRQQTLTMIDFAFGGFAAGLLHDADAERKALTNAAVARPRDEDERQTMPDVAQQIRVDQSTDFSIAISSLYQSNDECLFDVCIADSRDVQTTTHKYAGHSGLRKARTAKQILNAFRLYLLDQDM